MCVCVADNQGLRTVTARPNAQSLEAAGRTIMIENGWPTMTDFWNRADRKHVEGNNESTAHSTIFTAVRYNI